MSQLIRSHKAVTTAPRSMPPPPIAAATTPAEMDPRLANLLDPVDLVRPRVPQTPASSASLMALLAASIMCGHHHLCKIDTTSASTTEALGSQLEFC
ncbi:hypothetical protein DVH24_040987 [Malus domestica]|uniref:Uncharacterized protein n=1 Tax=Malus domestica TaxID=3750 RepID=A0A498I9K1_MALDO|nr:hypothetical protein DVH24_040987 [Malus domestica]